MSAFVSTQAAASPPTTPSPPIADAVANDGWFPSMSIDDTRAILNVTTTITPVRLRDAIIGGMLSINRQLRSWKLKTGADALDQVPQAMIGTTGELVEIYRRAVRAETAAILCDYYDTLSATDGGRKREETQEAPADHHRRIATHCVRDILGKGRTKVRLI